MTKETTNDEIKNTDVSNGFNKKIGRTHFLVNFTFKKGATESIKNKTKRLILNEATGKKM
jgi:hypothetical protein